ncbi:hypothetical protein [Acinetobacter beijerinckii]|uniref:Uncharacterized protein n=1 Tax=Acinetobacter beijerinckii CIP 110307 TaxID=1217648 RepID=N9DYC5_9GAMM|nr:hypothetical protein [Acinetobacter beijerinckii]ENW02932.1 hypothetical protein F933_03338 [Acinetobacter beijerinckii CIP 110307]
MKKRQKLILAFIAGICLILIMAYLLFVAENSATSLGFLLIVAAIFLTLLRYITKIKNDVDL